MTGNTVPLTPTRNPPFNQSINISTPTHRRAISSRQIPFSTPRKHAHNQSISQPINPFVARPHVPQSDTKKENFQRKRTTSLHEINLQALNQPASQSTNQPVNQPARRPGHHHSRSVIGDRFIPSRMAMPLTIDPDDVFVSPTSSPQSAQLSSSPLTPSQQCHNRHMASTLFESAEPHTARALTFGQPASYMSPTRDVSHSVGGHSRAASLSISHESAMRLNFQANLEQTTKRTVKRPTISPTAERVLDAPQLTDDYYLNLLDWSCTNQVAIALGCAVYIWNAATSSIEVALDLSERGILITSVKWHSDGAKLAIGCDDSTVIVVHAESQKRVAIWHASHSGRVGSLSWNGSMLSSGGRDGSIVHHELRQRDIVSEWSAHEEEVCGLAWSLDGQQLASGGNDNSCMLFSRDNPTPRLHMTHHTAAVKAIAWCPFAPHVLATGGGSNDRHIRLIHTATGQQIHSVDTKAQVCSIQWSQHSHELLSAHGFSINALCVWKYPTLTPVAQLDGHTARVLHTACSPDGTTVVSAAADETLRFWRVWERATDRAKPAHQRGQSCALLPMNIR